jgi:hypothetical protein
MQNSPKVKSVARHTGSDEKSRFDRTSNGKAPQHGDLLIRDFSVSTPGEFIIADALTLCRLQGPFGSLMDAAAAARALRPGSKVWRENVDSRGRALGPPIPLPVREP